MLEHMPWKETLLGESKLYYDSYELFVCNLSQYLIYFFGQHCRYGKQTISGLIRDGMSSLSRYYLNNFQDGVRQASCLLCFENRNACLIGRKSGLPFSWWKFCWISFFFYFLPQDAMDLISGHYTVNRNSPSPFQLNGFESFSVRINQCSLFFE